MRVNRWALVGAATLVVASVALVFVGKRGAGRPVLGAREAEVPAPFSVRIYGKDAPGERARLVADFPGTKEATVGMRAELHYFVKPGHTRVTVETRGAGGKVVTAQNEPGNDDLSAVGKAFAVGAFGPGPLEVCAAQSTREQTTLADAVNAGATKYCGTLWVTP